MNFIEINIVETKKFQANGYNIQQDEKINKNIMHMYQISNSHDDGQSKQVSNKLYKEESGSDSDNQQDESMFQDDRPKRLRPVVIKYNKQEQVPTPTQGFVANYQQQQYRDNSYNQRQQYGYHHRHYQHDQHQHYQQHHHYQQHYHQHQHYQQHQHGEFQQNYHHRNKQNYRDNYRPHRYHDQNYQPRNNQYNQQYNQRHQDQRRQQQINWQQMTQEQKNQYIQYWNQVQQWLLIKAYYYPDFYRTAVESSNDQNEEYQPTVKTQSNLHSQQQQINGSKYYKQDDTQQQDQEDLSISYEQQPPDSEDTCQGSPPHLQSTSQQPEQKQQVEIQILPPSVLEEVINISEQPDQVCDIPSDQVCDIALSLIQQPDIPIISNMDEVAQDLQHEVKVSSELFQQFQVPTTNQDIPIQPLEVQTNLINTQEQSKVLSQSESKQESELKKDHIDLQVVAQDSQPCQVKNQQNCSDFQITSQPSPINLQQTPEQKPSIQPYTAHTAHTAQNTQGQSPTNIEIQQFGVIDPRFVNNFDLSIKPPLNTQDGGKRRRIYNEGDKWQILQKIQKQRLKSETGYSNSHNQQQKQTQSTCPPETLPQPQNRKQFQSEKVKSKQGTKLRMIQPKLIQKRTDIQKYQPAAEPIKERKLIENKQKQEIRRVQPQPFALNQKPQRLISTKKSTMQYVQLQLNVEDITEIIIHSIYLDDKKIKTKDYKNDSSLSIINRKYKLPKYNKKMTITGWRFCKVRKQSVVILKTVSSKCRNCHHNCEEVVDPFNVFIKKCTCDKILHFDVKFTRKAVLEDERDY